MKIISFDKLLLKTGICCMASDGRMDHEEIELIKSLCIKSPLFKFFDFLDAINHNITEINSNGKEYIREYFGQLSMAKLSEQQELVLIDFAIKTIKANKVVEKSEVVFFKEIRQHLKISNESILKQYPDLNVFLEKDEISETFACK
jgi:uncharacterized tellurite resistance protein B-like protein